MRASIARRGRGQRVERGEGADTGEIDALKRVAAGLDLRELTIETAHGRTVITATAKYQLDKERLFEAIKQLDGWESDVVVDVTVECQDVRGYHTVEDGETLPSIARRYFGRESKDMAIFEANRDRMNDPSQILPGQQLLIPWR